MDYGDKDMSFRLAEQLVKNGRYDEAIIIYKELIKHNPGEDSFVLALAWAYLDKGSTEKAVECFEGLLEKEFKRNVFTGFAFDELVRIYREQGRYNRLIEICEKAVSLQKNDVSLLTTLGDAYFKAERFQSAIETFKKVIAMEPDATAVILRLGNAQVAAGDYEGAEEEFERAARADTAEAHTYYGRLGMAFMGANECGRAERAFLKAIEISPANPMYYCDLGDALICLEKLQDAWDAYEKAVSLRPESGAHFFNRLGNMLARHEDHEQAVSAFKKAVEQDAGNPFYYLHLARSYEAMGEHELASSAFEKSTTRGAGS
jgi:tetratricopeptide (TPR) repeat protein